MELLAEFSCIVLLGIILYQDFRQRQISWILLPLLFIALLFRAGLNNSLTTLSGFFFSNLSFVAFQLLCLTLYFSIKNKGFVNIINTYIGLGDILFFVVLCIAFSKINFIAFYLFGILLTIAGFLFYRLAKKNPNREIPLAGTLSLGLLLCFLMKQLITGFNFYDDYAFIQFIMK